MVAPPQPPPDQVVPKKQPGDSVVWFEFKPFSDLKDPRWGDVLTDLENHIPAADSIRNKYSDKEVQAHETTHHIHAYMNNRLQSSRTHSHLYVGNNKGVKFKNPKYTIADVAKLVPEELRKHRYKTYLISQQRGWNDEPLYLWDEWVAYCNGGECGIETVKKKLYDPNRNDAIWGVLEFNVYATYVLAAQKEKDPQMVEFFAWNFARGMRIYKDGCELPVFMWDDHKYLKFLREDEAAAGWRKFLIDTYGEQWFKDVFIW